MARPHDYSALPAHPSIGTNYRKQTKYGWTTVVADVTCPTCGKVRTYALYTLRQLVQKPHFSGKCFRCGYKESRESTAATLRRKFNGKTGISSSGYITVCQSAIPESDRHFFEAMRKSASFVFEHRLVMARVLNRPLRSDECIDHMDGNKQNNCPDNLRIYVRGLNQAGSGNGYGTYYHEWQMAERRARLLQEKIERLPSR